MRLPNPHSSPHRQAGRQADSRETGMEAPPSAQQQRGGEHEAEEGKVAMDMQSDAPQQVGVLGAWGGVWSRVS